MLTLRVLLVAAAAVTAVWSACLSQEWKQYRDKCYWRSNGTSLTWNDAIQFCSVLNPGATLVSIHDDELDVFIGEEVAGGRGAWLGLRCANGTASSCTWTDGTPYDYHNWYGSTSPVGKACSELSGECCALINEHVDRADWYGSYCYDGYRSFICQRDAS